jgi:hypothetical protein
MKINSELANIKNKVKTEDEIEEIIELEGIKLNVYTKKNNLVFEIPDTSGRPHSPEIKKYRRL